MGAHLYVWARVAYVPIYAAGIPLVRSLVWNVATIGIVLLAVALFRGQVGRPTRVGDARNRRHCPGRPRSAPSSCFRPVRHEV